MTKTRSHEQHRLAVELAAKNAHQSLIDAKQLYEDNEPALAFAIVRSVLPIAVGAAHHRILRLPTTRGFAAKPLNAYIKGLAASQLITADLAARLQRANTVSLCGWDDTTDTIHAINAALEILELTETATCKRKRQPQAAEVVEQPRRFSFRRWTAAAASVLGLSAS